MRLSGFDIAALVVATIAWSVIAHPANSAEIQAPPPNEQDWVEMPAEEVMPADAPKSAESMAAEEVRDFLGIVYEGGGWTVYKHVPTNEDSNLERCDAYAIYDHGFIRLRYDASTRRVEMTFSDHHSRSVKDGENVQVGTIIGNSHKIKRDEFMFVSHGQSFSVTDGVTPAGSREFMSSFNHEILTSLSKAEVLIFYHNKKVVAAFNLSGSARAIKSLRQCGVELADIDPEDVFAQ